MRKVLLLTKDGSLTREVSGLLPKGYKLVPGGKAGLPNKDEHVVFVDIDTENAHVIKEYSERTIVVAVTDQERTGPVMEAATWGAYEIMHRPLRKERIERLLEELRGLGPRRCSRAGEIRSQRQRRR